MALDFHCIPRGPALREDSTIVFLPLPIDLVKPFLERAATTAPAAEANGHTPLITTGPVS